MKAKLAFVAGLGAGYVVGTRVGRRGYEDLKKSARTLWQADKVQETVTQLEESVKDEAKELGSRLLHKATGNGANAKHDAGRNDNGQAAATKDTAAKAMASEPNADHPLPDVESDPALNDAAGRDWADEGGALPSGPPQ